MKLILFCGLLLTLVTYIHSASILGHGTDLLGHLVPVKCTVDCETEGPSFGPVLPHIPHPVDPIFPKPSEEAPADASAPPAIVPALHPMAHPFLAHHGVVAHTVHMAHPLGLVNHAVLAHPVIKHVDPPTHTLGGYATGPVDINGDGQSYTGAEDDHSPIAGGPVVHSLDGEAKWHGPYQGPVVHAPMGGFGDHHVLPHLAYGSLGLHSAVAHPGLVYGHGPAGGVVTGHGFALGLGPHLPASTHFGVVNTHDLLHRKLGDYAIADIKHLEEDCPPGLEGILFDKASKSGEPEATPVVEATPKESA